MFNSKLIASRTLSDQAESTGTIVQGRFPVFRRNLPTRLRDDLRTQQIRAIQQRLSDIE